MKVAPVITDNGTKHTGEILLLIPIKEAEYVVEALVEYAAKYKRSSIAKRLAKEAQSIPVS